MSRVRVTPLQAAILRMIDVGTPGIKAIAAEMEVSPKVVKRSVVSLGRKLGVPIPRMPERARTLGVRF